MSAGFFTLYRVSTQHQAEKFGLASQRRHLRPYGEQHLGPCLGEFDEGASSTSQPFEKRLVLQEMLVDIERVRPSYLLVREQSRVSREDDFALIKMVLRRAGTKLAFYRENGPPEVLDLQDEFDEVRSDMFAMVAKLQKRQNVRLMHAGKVEAAMQGHAVQPVSYGYHKPERGRVALHPERAQVVELIFARLASGEWSIRRLARELNGAGIPSPRGKLGGWTISYLAKLIKNTAYIGRAQMLGVEVAFPAIVDEATFHRAQAAVKENGRKAGRNNKRFDYLVRSLVSCGHCGRAICGTPKHDRAYYRCSGRGHAASKGVPPELRCPQADVQASEIDAAVWEKLKDLVLNPELFRAYGNSPPAVIAAEATFLRRKLDRYGERRERLLRQHEMGLLEDEELRDKLGDVGKSRAADEERLTELEAQAPQPTVDLTLLEEAEELCRELAPRLDNLEFAERRRLVEKLVRRVVVRGRKVSVGVVVPLSLDEATLPAIRSAPVPASSAAACS